MHKLRVLRDLKSYAVWVYLKNLYRNSCIYHYTIAGLARKSGLSRTAVRKYVALFLGCGWCRMHGRHLVFCKHSQLPDKRSGKRHLVLVRTELKEYTVQGILDSFYAFLVKDAQRKRQYARHSGDKLNRQAFSRGTRYPLPFTVYQGQNLLKKSTATVSRILQNLARRGWFLRIRRFRPVTTTFHPAQASAILESSFDGVLISYKGRIYRSYKSLIQWYPISEEQQRELYGAASNKLSI